MIDSNKIKEIFTVEGNAILALKETIDFESLAIIVDKIGSCNGKIVISGCGTSGVAAKKIVHSLSCISINAVYLNPTDAVHGSMGILKKNDVIILISKGGDTQELVVLIDSIKAIGACLVGVGENQDSRIGKASDLFICVKVDREPDETNMLATASTLAVISTFDAVCITLMDTTNFTHDKFLINHPAGAVGERLLKEQNNKK